MSRSLSTCSGATRLAVRPSYSALRPRCLNDPITSTISSVSLVACQSNWERSSHVSSQEPSASTLRMVEGLFTSRTIRQSNGKRYLRIGQRSNSEVLTAKAGLSGWPKRESSVSPSLHQIAKLKHATSRESVHNANHHYGCFAAGVLGCNKDLTKVFLICGKVPAVRLRNQLFQAADGLKRLPL